MKTMEEIRARMQQISEELHKEGVTSEEVRKLQDEIRSLNEAKAQIEKAAQEAAEARKAVADGLAGMTVETRKAEPAANGQVEIRNTDAYINAFANYIKSGDDRECRSLLTENAATGGQVPVPSLVDDIVRHAWENENILSRTRKTAFAGNVRVAFERSAEGAYIHAEGTDAPKEEELLLGIVEIKPENIKKWITLSDEMLETTGEGFLTYVYQELAYQVMKKLSAEVINDVVSAGNAHTATAVGIPNLTKNPGITTINEAAANLSDEAGNLCVVMNRLTEVEFITAYAAGNFAVDPFAGLPRVYTSALTAFSAANTGDVYAIVGDLNAIQVNFPAGEGLKTTYDNLSLAEKDLVKIVGRVYAGHEVTAPGRLIRLVKV